MGFETWVKDFFLFLFLAMNSIVCEFRLFRTGGVVQRTFFFLSVEITILGNVIFVLVMTWPLPPFGLCHLETAQSWTYL